MARGDIHVIYVVDDEDGMREFIAETLISERFLIRRCENGSVAWNFYQYEHEQVDLIITDIVMPVMDGLELLEKVQTICRNQPIAIISGYSKEKFTHLLGSNVIEFFRKPFPISDLMEFVEKHAKRR